MSNARGYRFLLGLVLAMGLAAQRAAADGAVQGKYCYIPPEDMRLNFALPVAGTPNVQMSLDDFKGHPVWINFFASWCAPCRAEAADVVAFAKKMRSSGLRVVGVDVKEPDAKADAYRAQFAIDYPVLLDRDGALFKQLGYRGIPSHIFIDATGRITCSASTYLDWHQIDNETSVILGSDDGGDIK